MAVLTSNYPASLDTTSTLGEVSNRAKTTLTVALTSGAETQISLSDASAFPNSGAVTIDNEIFYYSSKTGNVLTIEARGRQGTVAAAHSIGALVYLRFTKGHWEVHRTALISLETKLGITSSTPTASTWLKGTGAGTSEWSAISKSDVGLGSVENTALSTWAGSANLTTLGTVTTGTWSGTAIGVTKGGTGLTSIPANRIPYTSALNTLTTTANLYYDGLSMILTGSGAVLSVGAVSTNAKLNVTSTTEQLRIEYNSSNYYTTTVSSIGGVTWDAVGSGASFTFADKIISTVSATNTGLDLATSDAYAEMRVIRNSVNATDKDMHFGYQSGATSALHLYSNNTETLTVSGVKVGVAMTPSQANGILQVAGDIGVYSTTGTIRPASALDAYYLKFMGTSLVVGGLNSYAYNYSGGGLLASLSDSGSVLIMDVGSATSTGHRLKLTNDGTGQSGTLTLSTSSLTTFYANSSSGHVAIGHASPSARLHVIRTAEQLRVGYDTSNYYTTTVSSAGAVTFDAVGSSAGFTFSDAISATNFSGSHSGTSSGTNTGDQTITLTGDVTGSGTGSFATTIGANKVTLGMMATLAANSIIGNNTGSATTPIALSTAQVKTLLSLNNVENTALSTWGGSSNITTVGNITTGKIRYVGWNDLRSGIIPNTIAYGTMSVAFGTMNNNNTGNYSDAIILNAYTDSSGGNQNVLMIDKNAFGMRLFSGSSTSASAITTYRDIPLLNLTSLADDHIIQRKASEWVNRTPAQFKTDLALTKSDVGLANVQNVDQTNASNLTSGNVAVARMGSGGGTPSSSTFLRGDNTWATPTSSIAWGGITGTLSNQTDLNNALAAKAPLASPSFSGTPVANKMLFNNGDTNATYTREQIRFSYNGADQYQHYIHTRHNASTSSLNAIDFYTSDGVASGVFPTNAVHGMSVNGGTVGIGGVVDPSARLHVRGTSEQFRLDYDASNYFNITVSSGGVATLNSTASKIIAGKNLNLGSSQVLGSEYQTGNISFHADTTQYAIRFTPQGSGSYWKTFESGGIYFQFVPNGGVTRFDSWNYPLHLGINSGNAIVIDTSNRTIIGNAKVGDWSGFGSTYALFGHSGMSGAGSDYALLATAASGTHLNTQSGQTLYFRIGNSIYATLTTAGFDVSSGNLTISGSGAFSGRINPRVSNNISSSTPTPNANTDDVFLLTALAVGATFGAPSGTPVNGQRLMIRIKDNGATRTLAWNAIYRAIGVTMPLTTTANKTMYVGCIYNGADSKWDVVSVATEA